MISALDHPLTYLGVLVAAIVEGEIGYVAAAALVGHGYLDPVAVLVAGATGAALGDQFYFYLLRGRLRRWLDRQEAIKRRGRLLAWHVRRRETAMVLLIRFAPGLRIALAAACAYAGVPPVRFSTLNCAASIVWAAALLVLVAWVGPAALPALGISGWWSVLVPPLVLLLLFRFAARVERRALIPNLDEHDGPVSSEP
jgi:membrane protein DedA with SNARE-associated domain